jgi:hypothetical protein
LVAVGNGRLILVQAKRTKKAKVTPAMYADDLAKLRELAKTYELPPNTSLELWCWRDYEGFTKYDENGNEINEGDAT